MKFSYAYLHDDQQTMPIMRVGGTANRHDFQLRGVPVNPGGTLELGLALIRSDGERGHHGGSMATVQHRQRILAGARMSYALFDKVKLPADMGHDHVAPQNGDVRRLTKFTGAVALTTAPGYVDRPELRLFFTHAHWNGVHGTALSGYTVGLTFENGW
jgi:maltoporin